MIKFWKSAAKGKTGCPVRPPELNPTSQSNTKTLIQLEDSNYGDEPHLFEKKSKLSITLYDILIEKKAIKYFVQFMETIGKYSLIKCWLEVENFKTVITNISTNDKLYNHSKISRAKSFDLHCDLHKKDKKVFVSQRLSWRESSNNLSNTSECDNSTNSCQSLVEHATFTENMDCTERNDINITEEAIKLFKKYVALEAPQHLDLSDSVRNSVISNICQPEGQIKGDCFKPVQDALFSQMENDHYRDFQNSPLYIKAQIDIITSGSLNLKDILYNETILFYFTEYLEQESCSILLEFLMAVMHFRDNLINGNTSNEEQAQDDSIILYDKYFSLQATHPIGFSTDIRLKIESDICREGGPLPTCFDSPFQIVFKTLNKYVKTFLQSELYYKYLSEMIHSVDQMWSNHKSHSDCSSEFSISTQNTLLAMGDPVFRRKKRNHSVPDMTIDSNQLYNADALWQRKRQDGLSLGRVNSLGRFESKFEPDPDKRGKSVFKKMVSRFVPTNTAKVDEEMAWQIAHMIVKDVTDLTMAPPDTDRDYV